VGSRVSKRVDLTIRARATALLTAVRLSRLPRGDGPMPACRSGCTPQQPAILIISSVPPASQVQRLPSYDVQEDRARGST
jgi:hypothetical protein